jgi:hypothetical protein
MQFVRRYKCVSTVALALILALIAGCNSITGTQVGSSPTAALSSSSVTFGSVLPGASSPTQTITLSNNGSGSLKISNISLGGANPSSFKLSNNCSTSLAPGASCTIAVGFLPVTSGSYAAAVTITANTTPVIQTITLVGTAFAVQVKINPEVVILGSDESTQLTATVNPAVNQGVTWSISPVGAGSITASGLYTAPESVDTLQTVIATASSQADTSASSSTTITLVPSTNVVFDLPTATLGSGQSLQLTATVTGLSDTSVTWSALLGTITSAGLYTAPANTGGVTVTDTITATSVQDPTKSAAAALNIVPSGLVGWWPLDEGSGLVARDLSGQGNNGSWSGIPSSAKGTYYSSGLIGSFAAYFDGSDDQVNIGTRRAYQLTGPFTVSAWVNTVASGTILSMQDGGSNGYNLAINYGAVRFCVYASTTEQCAGGGSYPLAQPTWIYFTAIFDGSSISVYANGALINSKPAIAPTASTGPLVLGLAQRGGYSNLAGSLNDVRIYSRALSVSEMMSIYNTDVGPPNAPANLETYPGNGQVGLSWDSPTQGASLTGYLVNYREHNTATWITSSHPSSTATSSIVTGLTNDVSYDFEVIGVNGAGNGVPSTILTATPTAEAPAISVNVAPGVTSTTPGANLNFVATVTNALDTSVSWSALRGTITAGGVYTAPANTGNGTITDTITATSVQDPTKSATATINVASDLVGWWPLNEGKGAVAYDISGQGHNGAWTGSTDPASGTYYSSSGLTGSFSGYFDGTNNQVNIGTPSVYQFTGPFTISAWVNTIASGTILTMQDGGNNGYTLAINYGVIGFCIYANTKQQCVGGGSYPSSVPAWTYFTAVFDGSYISIYANGSLIAVNAAVAPTASAGPLVLGVAQRGGYSNFIGSMNDVRIYSRALSAGEISSMYNVVVGPPNAPTKLQTYPGNGQVGLSWDTPTQGAIVTDYTVNFRENGTNQWLPFAHNPSILNQQVVTGLSNGTSYEFEVIPVSSIGDGASSNTVAATPNIDGSSGGGATSVTPQSGASSSSAPSVVPSDDDEFVGPFSSWLNVKTDFGAMGDGVTDDTMAFQYALNALEAPSSHASVLYIPAGTYKITSSLEYISRNCSTYCSGKSIIGESPTNTILEWQGAPSGASLITLDGINRMQFDRLTLNGQGALITLVNETMHQGCCYDGSNEYTDDVFENAAIGIQAGDNSVGCCSAETKVDRDIFVDLAEAGISFEDWNALDWYVRYSTFEHDRFGVTNVYGEGGAVHLDHNFFAYNTVDSCWGNGASQSYTYNTSYHSGAFVEGSPYGNLSILLGNTVLNSQGTSISMPGVGPMTLIDNTVEGSVIAAEGGQPVTFSNGTVATPNSYVTSFSNTYVSASPFSVQNATYAVGDISGDLTSIKDAAVSPSSINDTVPMMPGPLPNYKRTIYEVPQSSSGAVIQQTINQAVAENNGNRPVVHIPWGQYSVSSTISIPSNSDVQIVGDNIQTILNWSGSSSSPVFALLPSSHATIRNLQINAGSASAGILVQGNDQPGDRIYTNFVAEGSSGASHNLLVNGFDNTLVQMDDFGHGGQTNPSSISVLVVGGPRSQAGEATPGYTGLFMGSSCCNVGPSYRVENGATLVLTGFWYEQGGTSWLDLDNATGNFIGYEDNIAVDSWGTVQGAVPAISAVNFTGNLTIADSLIQNSYVNLAGSTPANVLMLGDNFNSVVTSPVITKTNTNPNTQAATIYPTWMNGSVAYTAPDEVSSGTSRTGLLQASLGQLSSYKDPPLVDLPSTNEDVRLIDIVVNNAVNSYDFESSGPDVAPANQVHQSVGRSALSVSTNIAQPSSPWCKRIETHGQGQYLWNGCQ